MSDQFLTVFLFFFCTLVSILSYKKAVVSELECIKMHLVADLCSETLRKLTMLSRPTLSAGRGYHFSIPFSLTIAVLISPSEVALLQIPTFPNVCIYSSESEVCSDKC